MKGQSPSHSLGIGYDRNQENGELRPACIMPGAQAVVCSLIMFLSRTNICAPSNHKAALASRAKCRLIRDTLNSKSPLVSAPCNLHLGLSSLPNIVCSKA